MCLKQNIMINSLKTFFKTNKYKKRFYSEYADFLKGNKNSDRGYAAFRKLFVLTKGKLNDDLSNEINKEIGKYESISNDGILGKYAPADTKQMVSKMKEDGFYVFETSLSEEKINAIYHYAKSTPVSYMNAANDNQEYSEEKVLFDENHPVSPRYQFTTEEIFKCPELQELIFDKSLLGFAQEYLGCKPILDLVAFWWSAPFEGKGKNAAAQMYHFDLDRIKFMKFFFYITDVDTHTGPHCYVKGSHKTLPSAVNRDGRYEDEEMETIYGKENLLELCGKKGAIMAVDTRGFHKGKDLTEGKRLLFQIQFTNSLFGQSYADTNAQLIDEKYSDLVAKYEYSYQHIS